MSIRITLKRGNKRKVITCANPKRRNPGRLVYWYKMKTGGHWFSLVARPGETPAERLHRAIYTDASAIGAMPAGMSLGTWRNMASNAVYHQKHTVPVLKKTNPKRRNPAPHIIHEDGDYFIIRGPASRSGTKSFEVYKNNGAVAKRTGSVSTDDYEKGLARAIQIIKDHRKNH